MIRLYFCYLVVRVYGKEEVVKKKKHNHRYFKWFFELFAYYNCELTRVRHSKKTASTLKRFLFLNAGPGELAKAL